MGCTALIRETRTSNWGVEEGEVKTIICVSIPITYSIYINHVSNYKYSKKLVCNLGQRSQGYRINWFHLFKQWLYKIYNNILLVIYGIYIIWNNPPLTLWSIPNLTVVLNTIRCIYTLSNSVTVTGFKLITYIIINSTSK